MTKKIRNSGFLFLGFLLVALLWLSFKPYDYTVSFKTKALPGTLNQTLKSWNILQEDAKIVSQNKNFELVQQLRFNDSTFIYDWRFSSENDSITKVNLGISNKENSFKNRIYNLFGDTDFKKRTKQTVYNFIAVLDAHLEKIRVTIDGESTTPAVFTAYVSLKAVQNQKAKGMMQNYQFLNSFLLQHNFEFDGLPMVEITKWDQKTDSIHYNFCYPIVKKDSLPKHANVQFKEFTSTKALKATYNGNYITSDRAWYALLKEAKKKNIEVLETPLEIFYNNPNYSSIELDWKAEVYLPIKLP